MASYLLDSNIVTCILRKRGEEDFQVIDRFKDILVADARILIYPIVFYEVARGLYHNLHRKDAQPQLNALGILVKESEWCEFDSETWDVGARLWADCRRKGTPTGHGLDKDVLIAAQVRKYNAILVTNNTKHFRCFGITLENWTTRTP